MIEGVVAFVTGRPIFAASVLVLLWAGYEYADERFDDDLADSLVEDTFVLKAAAAVVGGFLAGRMVGPSVVAAIVGALP